MVELKDARTAELLAAMMVVRRVAPKDAKWAVEMDELKAARRVDSKGGLRDNMLAALMVVATAHWLEG